MLDLDGDLCDRVWAPKKTQNVNINVFNILIEFNDGLKSLDGLKCNSEQNGVMISVNMN